MNYTDWLQGKFSKLSNASSAETYCYIKQAKSETKFIRGFIGIAILIAIILPSNMLLSSMGFVPFESVIYWCTFIVVVLISSSLSKKVEENIIKNKLSRIVQAKYN